MRRNQQPKQRPHDCPGGCGRQVPRHLVACQEDWRRLPADLRSPITATYRRDLDAHADALVDAFAWYGENPRGQVQA